MAPDSSSRLLAPNQPWSAPLSEDYDHVSPGPAPAEHLNILEPGQPSAAIATCSSVDGNEPKGDQHRDDGSQKLWAPFFLRRTAMLAFLATFIGLLLALVALYAYSARDQGRGGISRADQKNHYLWTYGPTALFVTLDAFWGQVQCRAAELMPWKLMSQSHVPASSSILLDYISSWNVLTLLTSLKKKHFLVSLAVVGSLLIKTLTVLSTGLFAINVVSVTYQTRFLVTHDFDGTRFDPDSVDARAYALSLGSSSFNMSAPVGIVGNHAFQPFRDGLADQAANDVYLGNHEYHADVDIFTMELDCANATTETIPRTMNASMKAAGCAVEFLVQSIDLPYDKDAYALKVILAGCGGELIDLYYVSEPRWAGRSDVRSVDWRLWAFVSHQNPNGQRSSSAVGRPEQAFEFISLMCTPRYSMSHGPATISRPRSSRPIANGVEVDERAQIDSLSGVTAGTILYSVYRSISMTDNSRQSAEYKLISTSSDQLAPFWNVTLLTQEIQRSVKSIAVQVARAYLLRPVEDYVHGTVKTSETRLFVRQLSVGLMVGMLVLLITIAILLIVVYVPLAVCPRDPSSIGGLATILARSPELMTALTGMETRSDAEMRRLLVEHNCRTGITADRSFSIHLDGGSMPMVHHSSDQIRWWHPFSATILARLLVLGVPAALISTVAILYRISEQSDGIALVEGKPAYIRYTWVYIPALAMLCVRTLFQTVEFSARIFQPYHCLHQGGASARSSILEDQHHKIGIYAVVDALRKRQWALASAALAVLLAAFLPIAVSGLYTAKDTIDLAESSLTQLHRWTLSDPGSGLLSGLYYSVSSQDVILSGMILHLNLSYPQWTYQDLVFPRVALTTTSTADAPLGPTYEYVDARLPALRGSLNCNEIPPTRYFSFWSQLDSGVHILEINVTDIERCRFPGQSFAAFVPDQGGYFSGWEKAHDPNPPDCPTRLVVYGKALKTNATEAMTVLGCRPRIEQVDADVRLVLPSYEFDEARPPLVVPGSALTLYDGFFNTSPQFDVFPNDSGMSSYLMAFKLGSNDDGTADLDDVIKSAIYGVGGTPADELLDPAKLIQGLTRVYGIVIAQLLNGRAHEPLNATTAVTDGHVYKATLVDTTSVRLVQSAISTYILEALLAAMIVCGAVAMACMKTRRVLPKNPCSIAAVASLLVGAKMLQPQVIPPGAEWCDDGELKKRGIFEGLTFTLGWWTRRDEGVVHEAGGDVGERAGGKRFGIDVDDHAWP